MKSLTEKVVIIMGASSGIGEATTRLLAEKGAKLVIAARREDRLVKIKNSLPDAELVYKAADVSNYEDVKRVVDLAVETYGHVEGRRDEWKEMLDINIMGVLNGISAVLPLMAEQKSGHIISTDSVAGHVVYPDSAVYCGTKFAVRAIMEGLRQEQRKNNIKSTIISPGAVQTELYKTISDSKIADEVHKAQIEWGLTSEDIAMAVVFAIDTPDRMSVSEMIVRPTTQSI